MTLFKAKTFVRVIIVSATCPLLSFYSSLLFFFIQIRNPNEKRVKIPARAEYPEKKS
jgi:hypothetical protein